MFESFIYREFVNFLLFFSRFPPFLFFPPIHLEIEKQTGNTPLTYIVVHIPCHIVIATAYNNFANRIMYNKFTMTV